MVKLRQRPNNRSWTLLSTSLVGVVWTLWSATAQLAPTPIPHPAPRDAPTPAAAPTPAVSLRGGPLDTSEWAFNAGEGHRMATAEVMALLREPGAGVWRYHTGDWSKPERSGHLANAAELEDAVRGGRLAALVDGFKFDWDGDGQPDYLLVPKVRQLELRQPFAPVLLNRDKKGALGVLSRPLILPGEHYSLEDIRDHDGDGRVEIILSGQVGANSFYTYYVVWALDRFRNVQRFVTRAPDTLHLVDLEKKGRFQLLLRRLLSQRGPIRLWTWLDEVHEWNGARFVQEPERFRAYHDQVTKRRLVDELIDCYDEDPFISRTKVDLMRKVHAQQQAHRPIQVPTTDYAQRVKNLIADGDRERARSVLMAELVRDPYDVVARSLLAELFMMQGRYGEALDEWYQVLGQDPENASAWFAAGECFARIQERSAAAACFVNSVRLAKEPQARQSHLESALASAVDEESLVLALQQALRTLK